MGNIFLFVYLLTWDGLEGMDMFRFWNERADGKGDAEIYTVSSMVIWKAAKISSYLKNLSPFGLLFCLKFSPRLGILCQEIVSITVLLK